VIARLLVAGVVLVAMTDASGRRADLDVAVGLGRRSPTMQAATDGVGSKHAELAARFTTDLDRVASAVDGSVGYLIVDLTTGQRFARRADEPFPTASAIKIGILYELFAQADAGRVTLDEPRALPPESRAGGAGILQRLRSPMLSLRDHALLMILLSDNTATNVLIDTLGREAVNARMQALGAHGYRLRRRMMDGEAAKRGDENVASPQDLVTVMDALRTGRGLRAESRDEALRILREYGPTPLRAGVPAGVSVAAKPGGLEGVRTEIGFVDLKDRPYLICVMTSFLADDAAGNQVVTDLSRLSYAYFVRLAAAGVEGRLLRAIPR
jgi:beta-lactamase class A